MKITDLSILCKWETLPIFKLSNTYLPQCISNMRPFVYGNKILERLQPGEKLDSEVSESSHNS